MTERRDQEWLTSWLLDPDQMRREDPDAKELSERYEADMPNLGLTEAEVVSLIVFLGGEAAPPGDDVQPPPEPSGGEAAVGKNLFTGTSRFRNGGPSCRACHGAGGIGALGGGTLGPDLTLTYNRLGDAMITWPETMPPMQAIFSDRPLTEEEKAHLLAFFQSVSVEERPGSKLGQLIGIAVGGTAAFGLLAHVIWRKRLRGVREPIAGPRSGGIER